MRGDGDGRADVTDGSERASATVRRTRKISTGVQGLDRILEGGLPKREIYLVQGDPGTGKTTFGLQFLLAGRDLGEPGLFITLTQREADLQDTAASHGWSLEGIHVHQLKGPSTLQQRSMADQALFPTGDVELTEVMDEVMEVVERVRPKRVVFDAIAELRLLADDSTRFQHQIFALRELFASSGATVVFLDTPSQLPGTREMEHIAHGVILLEHTLTRFGNAQRRLRVLKMRGMGYGEGLHDCRIQPGGFVVFPRLLPGEESVHEGKLLESGVAMLDQLVGGGLAEGTSCLFVGPSGAGKSSVATLYACAAAERGERSAAFLFEERPETFIRRSESLGMPVRSYIESGLMLVRPINTAELSPGEFAEFVRQQVQERGVRVVTIDSLTGYISAMPDEQMLLTQMHDLLQYLSGQGVLTILVVAQHGIVGSTLAGPIDVSYLADAVLLFRHFESNGEIRRALSVFKKRYGDHEKMIRELVITTGGIHVGEPLRGFRGLLTGNPAPLDTEVRRS